MKPTHPVPKGGGLHLSSFIFHLCSFLSRCARQPASGGQSLAQHELDLSVQTPHFIVRKTLQCVMNTRIHSEKKRFAIGHGMKSNSYE